MAVWQTQKDFPSETARTRETVSYLDREIGRELIHQIFEQYFAANPQGEQVTLAVLKGIGRQRVEALAAVKASTKGKPHALMVNLVKQHIGLWTAICLASRYGPSNVATYRQRPNESSSTRKTSDSWLPELSWVNAYTPHRVQQTSHSPSKGSQS